MILTFTCALCGITARRAFKKREPPRFCSRRCATSCISPLLPLPLSERRDTHAKRRSKARAFVADVNGRTDCAHCGAQPIEWHNPEHVELNRKRFRIGEMVAQGQSIQSIKDEMANCTPLCRRCHMTEDGRFDAFMAQAKRPKTQPPKICSACGSLAKPLRLGTCSRCYDRARQRRRARMPLEVFG